MVEVPRSPVVAVLVFESFGYAGAVAGVAGSHTVASLQPAETATLTAAAREEKIVVQLVVVGCFGAIKDSRSF